MKALLRLYFGAIDNSPRVAPRVGSDVTKVVAEGGVVEVEARQQGHSSEWRAHCYHAHHLDVAVEQVFRHSVRNKAPERVSYENNACCLATLVITCS